MSVETIAIDRETVLSPMPDLAWHTEVDHARAAEWSEMLDLFDDANIYQTWSYGAVRWGTKNLSHLVLKRNGEVVAIAQLRIVRPAGLKFGLAYLRWGPICQRKGSELEREVLSQMAQALYVEYVVKRGLLLKIIPNAFAGSLRSEMFQSAFSNFSQEELRRKLDPKWRNKLSGAEKNCLRVISGNSADEYRTFCGMYREMRNRKEFETTVDIQEFGRIQEELGETERLRILIVERSGVPLAGMVASAIGDSAIYLLGATSDEGLKAKGSYLLQWTLIQWLKENGVRWYDLGGIDPEGNPGVYQFKKGFSGADVCQLTPLAACRNPLSSAVANAGLAVNRMVRGIRAMNLGRRHRASGSDR